MFMQTNLSDVDHLCWVLHLVHGELDLLWGRFRGRIRGHGWGRLGRRLDLLAELALG